MKHLSFFLLAIVLLNGCAGKGSSKGQSDDGAQRPETETSILDTAPAPSPPKTIDGNLDYIAEFIGRRPGAVDLWQTEPLRSHLQRLLGDDLSFYTEIMQESMALKKDRVIYTVGIAPDDAVPGIGYLLIDTENDKVKVFGVFGDHTVEAQSPGEPLYLPQEVKEQVERILHIEQYEI